MCIQKVLNKLQQTPGSIIIPRSEPTLDSYKFSGSVTIDSSEEESKSYYRRVHPSASSNTYLINEKFSIPILSIVTNQIFYGMKKGDLH